MTLTRILRPSSDDLQVGCVHAGCKGGTGVHVPYALALQIFNLKRTSGFLSGQYASELFSKTLTHRSCRFSWCRLVANVE